MQKKPRAPRPRQTIDWGHLLHKHSVVLVKLGGLGFLACIGYFLYAVYGGGLQNTPPQLIDRTLALISGFGTAFTITSFVLALGVALMTLDELAYTVILALGGVGVMLGLPAMVANNLANLSPEFAGVTRGLSASATRAGVAILVVVGGRIVYDIFLYFREAPQRRRIILEKQDALETGALKKHATAKRQTVMSPCWELPFCHPRIRELCPAYKARKTCWRYGSGCNCSPKMIEALIRAGAPGKGPKTHDRRRIEGAYIRSDLEADVPRIDKLERTISCRQCPIFTEHQRLKFKFVTPVAVIATIVGMGALYIPIAQAWDFIAAKIVVGAAAIALGQVRAEDWFGYLQDTTVRIFFFIILFLLALSYVLKFIEWAVIDKKIL